jgi:phosphatidylserine/phosphatidylglycerophosphate/cardiolipin synthase-like enzyme
MGGCRSIPEVDLARTLPLTRSRIPVDIENADGMLGRAARVAATSRLAAIGDTDLLDFHLAAMRDIGAPSLLTGNRVELLIDGPRTYQAMFDAIEKAREYVLVESFIFEEASAGDRQLSALLAQAAQRGVHVQVLYDAIGSLTTDAQFLASLERAGVVSGHDVPALRERLVASFSEVFGIAMESAPWSPADHREAEARMAEFPWLDADGAAGGEAAPTAADPARTGPARP